jgi:hypothetical protein
VRTAARPTWVVAKGGITSHDVAVHGLSIRRAEVLGQLLPGMVPVFRPLQAAAEAIGMPYVIPAQRVDLSSHAQRIADAADTLTNPALAGAAHDYAAFLDDLAARRDPLWRTVTVAVTAHGEKGRDTEVLRRPTTPPPPCPRSARRPPCWTVPAPPRC